MSQQGDAPQPSGVDGEAGPTPPERRRRFARVTAALGRADGDSRAVAAAKVLRDLLPGDRNYGDPLSVAGREAPQLVGQRLSALSGERPSALRELGMSALQVWQALAESRGRGRGDRELVILFTDLVDFSKWALDAGDEQAVELLRRVGLAAEPPIAAHGGQVVKRLGDGLMAVFPEPEDAVGAAIEAARAVEEVEVAGHRPGLRAGVHLGRPRHLGGDYLGVDVNVAARVAAAAGAGEVLVSDAVRERLEDDTLDLRRRWRFKGKGAPKQLRVYAATRDPDAGRS